MTTRSSISRAIACRSAAVVVGAVHSAGISSARRRMATCSSGEGSGLICQEVIIVGRETKLRRQRLLPALLQRAGDQPVLRLDGIILPARTLDLVAGAFEPLLPLPMQRGTLQLQVFQQL